MLEVFGAGRIFSLVKFEEAVHPVVDSLLDKPSIDLLCSFLQGLWIVSLGEGVVFHFVRHPFLIQLMPDVIMTVEIELAGEGQIGRYF